MARARREVTLAPERESARAARHLLREILAESGREEWLDDAELALSEVVTNAMLHAHTDIELVVDVSPDLLCVEVRDYDRTLPVARNYGEEAVTGRGMALVAAITQKHGVHQLNDGKVVWFCIGTERSEPSVDELLDAWAIDFDDDIPEAEPARRVVLEAMPVALWLAAREHHDALIRELCHWTAEHGEGVTSLDVTGADRARSAVSGTLVHVLGARHGPDTSTWPATIDLVIEVADDGGRTFEALQDTLDFGESLALDGQLLIQPALPEIVAVRDWVCEQAIAQMLGMAPTPWPGTAQERFETEVRDQRRADGGWDDEAVTHAAGAVVAADEANRIVGASDAALALLGWQRADLVGRRVVTIVPSAWRERHVAGFSRHVSTGETKILGQTLELPVLTASGDEVLCRVRIDRLPGPGARVVYAAWIEPVT